jgi:hypothetical protein
MRKLIFAAAALVAVNGTLRAQAPRPIELGIDAGITIGIGDDRGTDIAIPAQTLRVGFPLSARTSLEPKLGVAIHTGGGETFTDYRAELGLLYHLGTSKYPGAYQRAGMYVRPFIGVSGVSDGVDVTSGLVGIGVGYKFPIVSRLSSRFEANVAQHFGDDDFTEIGLLAGLSFFTR